MHVFQQKRGLPVHESAVTIEVRDAPVSLNRARGAHWSVFRKEKQRWQDQFEGLLMAISLPRGLAHVHATAVIRFPVRRPRDEGNFRWMLEKALGDALTNGRWLADDTPEHFTTGAVTFEKDPGAKRTVVTLTYRKERDEVPTRGSLSDS